MHIGLSMFPTEYAIEPHHLAIEAEARAFESLWFPEHTHIPAGRRTPYPGGGDLPKEYWHTFDPFGALCAAAAGDQNDQARDRHLLAHQRDTIVTAKETRNCGSALRRALPLRNRRRVERRRDGEPRERIARRGSRS